MVNGYQGHIWSDGTMFLLSMLSMLSMLLLSKHKCNGSSIHQGRLTRVTRTSTAASFPP